MMRLRGILLLIFLAVGTMATAAQSQPPDRNYETMDRISLTWGPVTWAAEYQIQVADSPTFNGTLLEDRTVGVNTLFFEMHISNDGVYYWRVRAKKADGSSGVWSKTESFTVDLPIARPILISPNNGSVVRGQPVTFTWGNASGAVNYEFNAYLPDGFQFSFQTPNLNFSTAQCFGLCTWRVRAQDIFNNWSAWSDWWTVDIEPPQPPVVNLISPNNEVIHTQKMTFSWERPIYSDGYTYDSGFLLQIDNDSDFSSPAYSDSNFTVNQDGNTLSASYPSTHDPILGIRNLLPDGVYYWRMQAINSLGEAGSWSIAKTFDMQDSHTDCTPIPGGSTTYFIGHNVEPGWPQFTQADFSDIDPGAGQPQSLVLHVRVKPDPANPEQALNPITSVTVSLILDHGVLSTPSLSLASGDGLNGNWEGAWFLDEDTRCYNYYILFDATNATGTSHSGIVMRNS